jgi:hypothetical protein
MRTRRYIRSLPLPFLGTIIVALAAAMERWRLMSFSDFIGYSSMALVAVGVYLEVDGKEQYQRRIGHFLTIISIAGLFYSGWKSSGASWRFSPIFLGPIYFGLSLILSFGLASWNEYRRAVELRNDAYRLSAAMRALANEYEAANVQGDNLAEIHNLHRFRGRYLREFSAHLGQLGRELISRGLIDPSITRIFIDDATTPATMNVAVVAVESLASLLPRPRAWLRKRFFLSAFAYMTVALLLRGTLAKVQPAPTITATPSYYLCPLTMRNLFDSDFPQMHITQDVTTEHISPPPSSTFLLTYQLILDFDANTERLAVFIPRSVNGYLAARSVALGYQNVINQLNQREQIWASAPGDSAQTKSTDLSFSGRIYLYLEDAPALSLRQMAELEQFYADRKLAVEFRGQSYWALHSNDKRLRPGATLSFTQSGVRKNGNSN